MAPIDQPSKSSLSTRCWCSSSLIHASLSFLMSDTDRMLLRALPLLVDNAWPNTPLNGGGRDAAAASHVESPDDRSSTFTSSQRRGTSLNHRPRRLLYPYSTTNTCTSRCDSSTSLNRAAIGSELATPSVLAATRGQYCCCSRLTRCKRHCSRTNTGARLTFLDSVSSSRRPSIKSSNAAAFSVWFMEAFVVSITSVWPDDSTMPTLTIHSPGPHWILLARTLPSCMLTCTADEETRLYTEPSLPSNSNDRPPSTDTCGSPEADAASVKVSNAEFELADTPASE